GIPLQDVSCSSHEVDIKFNENSSAQIDLKSSDKIRGNKDFILHYRLTGNKIQEGLMLYEGEDKQGYFLMMLQPPKTVAPTDLPGREYIFIMDVSGSQSGFPLEVSKELMKNLLTGLRPKDVFNVMVFEGRAGFMSETAMKATPENITKAVEFVDKQNAGGATQMLSAIKKAMTFPKTENFSRTFAISTDGYISMEPEVFEYIKNNLGEANFFAFGIGTSVNRLIIEGIAHAGMGEQFVVTKKEEAAATAEKFKTYISNPVLTNIKINYGGFGVSDVVPLNVPDVFALRPIIVFGKYKGAPSGNITVSGINASGKYSKTINVASAKAGKENSALKYLWARHTIRGYELDGKIRNDRKKEITQLGLEYGLLTEYTSFVAVDSEIRNQGGKQDSIAQPLPLPEGVSNNALMFTARKQQMQQANSYKSMSDEKIIVREQYKKMAVEKKTESIKEYKVAKESNSIQRSSDNEIKTIAVADTVSKVEEVAEKVEVMPEFPGGQDSLQKFLRENIKYPKSAKDAKIEGTVYIRFTVGKDGTIKNVVLVKGQNQDLANEALRVVKLMPKWKPGMQTGKVVAVLYTMPVKFKL
ncbi:MAG: TonB family protein, partial [Bacteroidia bacterium]|nr:TonB family protein [Bacteroidia bacterium]